MRHGVAGILPHVAIRIIKLSSDPSTRQILLLDHINTTPACAMEDGTETPALRLESRAKPCRTLVMSHVASVISARLTPAPTAPQLLSFHP